MNLIAILSALIFGLITVYRIGRIIAGWLADYRRTKNPPPPIEPTEPVMQNEYWVRRIQYLEKALAFSALSKDATGEEWRAAWKALVAAGDALLESSGRSAPVSSIATDDPRLAK